MGGTFHPIHKGHVAMAIQAKEELNMDCVHLMVDRVPPHKDLAKGATPEQRLAMVKLECSSHAELIADDTELQRVGKSYTADTLETFSKQHPKAELFFIMGSDMLETIMQWYDPQRIMSLATLVCVRRAGMRNDEDTTSKKLIAEYGAKVKLLEPVAELSSTEIRNRIAEYRPISGLVSNSVENYIYENGLYLPGKCKTNIERIRASMSEKRFHHTIGVITTALRLADENSVDGQKTFQAALLHDCAKALPLDELISITGDEAKYAPILHAEAGAIIARRDYGQQDEDVLKAIRLHTTGDEEMSRLDKIIYLADMIEPSRNFEGIDEIRKEKNLDKAFLLALRRSIWYIKSNGQVLHPATLRAYKSMGGTDG